VSANSGDVEVRTGYGRDDVTIGLSLTELRQMVEAVRAKGIELEPERERQREKERELALELFQKSVQLRRSIGAPHRRVPEPVG